VGCSVGGSPGRPRSPDAGWEKAWVEQIIDRVMKGMLKTTEDRTTAVVRAAAVNAQHGAP
jgi:hypothetical protein